MRAFVFSLVALAALAGCSKSQPGDPEPITSGARTYIEATNNFALPVEIWVMGSGSSHRLGTVHPGMGGHFTLPQTFGTGRNIEFIVRSGGSAQPYRSQEILLHAGMIIDLNVAAVLFNSTTVVRAGS